MAFKRRKIEISRLKGRDWVLFLNCSLGKCFAVGLMSKQKFSSEWYIAFKRRKKFLKQEIRTRFALLRTSISVPVYNWIDMAHSSLATPMLRLGHRLL